MPVTTAATAVQNSIENCIQKSLYQADTIIIEAQSLYNNEEVGAELFP